MYFSGIYSVGHLKSVFYVAFLLLGGHFLAA